MILDSLSNARYYEHAHPLFAKAFKFLLESPLATLDIGRIDIQGDDVFALVQEPDGKDIVGAKLEAHRRYIDLQMIVSGDEVMGWAPLSGLGHDLGFNEEKDCGFWSDKPMAFFPVRPGCFAIFFPEDAHAPNCGKGKSRKIVVKIKA
ncbi:YhcH/YjgK/YiaL family protein [Oligosphaera ethanolica]|uniref:YhcH/YjgK/YiaL family protein n=1 Tax=Oligosphaera ethanolica TaxID=760260 RepID=A0AAE4AQH4_9BACT|nr:YhcH/YjgK/YiaL family protein [Oligosphaera ethanolica]MDQ0290442.1 YhcH/YjgK/YiaL family protein [Oligosphaera ethanolica]